MSDFYQKPETPQECEDRLYWGKRFGFASWLFLFMALYAIFTDNLASAAIAIAVSVGFHIFNTVHQIRHIKWHLKNDSAGGEDMHL